MKLGLLLLSLMTAQAATLPPRVGVSGAPLPLTLPDAIRLALEQNADVDVARIDLRSADQGVRAAQGAFDPRFRPVVSFQRGVNPSASALGGAVAGAVELRQLVVGAEFGGRTPWAGGRFAIDFTSSRNSTSNLFARLNPQYPTGLGVTYVQPLLRDRDIDADRRAILLAQRAADLSRAELNQVVMDQLMLVEQAFWELTYATGYLDVQVSGLEQALGQVASNERQAREGTLAPIDVVEAQTQAATFRQTVALAQQALTEAENRLKLLMLTSRTAPEWSRPVVPGDFRDREEPTWPLEEAVRLALLQRPELAALDTTRASAEINRRFFQDQTRPQMDVSTGFSLGGLAGGAVAATDASIPSFLIGGYGTSLGNLFARRYPSAVVQLQVDLPIRNTTARANLARAELDGARVDRQRQQLEQVIESEVRNAMQAVRSARDRLTGASTASRNAREQYESERRRFDSGLSTVFLVLDRQATFVATQARELRARTDLNQAIAFLDRAVGGTLEHHRVSVK